MKKSEPGCHRAGVRRCAPCPARADTIEQDLIGPALVLLRMHGCTVWRNNAGEARRGKSRIKLSPAGVPDITGFMPDGRFIGVELKRERGKAVVRPAQDEFLHRLHQAGGVAILARSLQEIEERLPRRGER